MFNNVVTSIGVIEVIIIDFSSEFQSFLKIFFKINLPAIFWINLYGLN